jgi:hypothetical protein
MLVLLGLTDDYAHDGRALAEVIHEDALPRALRDQRFLRLAQAYKEIQAPLGALGVTTLDVSTKALAGDDATYAALEGALSHLTDQRDALAATIAEQLEAAEFGEQALDEASVKSLVQQAHDLIEQAKSLSP